MTSLPGGAGSTHRTPVDLADRLLDIKRIYHEPDIERLPRARAVLDRFPDAERIEVLSHQAIPGLYGNEGNVEDWVRIKQEVLVLGEKKSLSARRNERSSDWIAPSTANGCAMACSYCYVPRRKGYANPITVFANIEKITGYLERHAARQGAKPEPNQCDPVDWVYDIGENSDCSADAVVSDNVRDLVDLFGRIPNAKASFATKLVNRDLLTYDPRGGTRVRFSLMPAEMSRLVDVRTSKMSDRIAALDDFVEAGYEVHLNLSPVIVHENWLADWTELLDQIADNTNDRTKRQLAAEIIFLTHNEGLHEVNLGWHPKGEDVLWRPDLQQLKRSQNGQWNVRYKSPWKGRWVQQLTDLVATRLPDCRIRYAF
ncbi:spore photoproduct lyase family protein [Mycolicibacterium litorale]|uniref:Spore photoproduct lyase family protein n=1 Tax=Mycolicibacterium litorale TaxID=758802 RepID=A0AAD1MUD1_9MYCO|nr:spore photoproduct lyase family protein [Mycolicibacterium litorale]MCV7414912.1 spore photoproduct lyase family protein [Mycolicibacterium litorale]TDY08158.1 spore photoproduct lyase family protein [Mycolicibacterium litorale]BBY16081.1 spore photoproduct lyase family protein [Mycolicibacterium litorale]